MTKKTKTSNKSNALPTRDQILEYIDQNDADSARRDIARAFGVKGADRAKLRALLKEMEDEGVISRARAKSYTAQDGLPAVAILEVTSIDSDGDLHAYPVKWEAEGPAPDIVIVPDRGRGKTAGRAPAVGDRILGRLRKDGPRSYRAQVLKRLPKNPDTVVGEYRVDAPGARGGRVIPADKKDRREYFVAEDHAKGASDGDVVVLEPDRQQGSMRAAGKIAEIVGRLDEPKTISLISIQALGIPTVFPDETIAQAERAKPAVAKGRTDLRDIPLITIDGADARDFDDAVWAEPDPDPKNKGGWHLLVAIADVAWYARPDDALDREARKRGNSVYFPDRVVPMLPERLSNDLCSLRPDEDRACMAVHMWVGKDGRLRRHEFVRGLMRSAARLTYERAQAEMDGAGDAETARLKETVLAPLYGAYSALLTAREARGALDLDLPERQVILGDDGHIEKIVPRQRLDSHKLIEEFMILANVAAAETLEARKFPCMYRVHEPPSPEKIHDLSEFLQGLGYKLPKSQSVRPEQLNQVLGKAKGTNEERLINQVMLRSQSQAVYAPENAGHFGLALARYAHFTSPIRRYSDLLVHRALIGGLGLGEGGIERLKSGPDRAAFAETGEHISQTERRAMAAERNAMDRYLAAYHLDHVGAEFPAHISGVTRFGLFLTLDETGADGLIPIRSLPDDFYDVDEVHHKLRGRRHGREFRLGQSIVVRLLDAVAVTGGLIFEILDESAGRGARPTRSKPAKRATDKKPARTKGKKPAKPKGKSRAARRKQRARQG